MLYLTCTTITSIDLAHYGVSRAKDWVSVKCGTSCNCNFYCIMFQTLYTYISVLRLYENILIHVYCLQTKDIFDIKMPWEYSDMHIILRINQPFDIEVLLGI